MPRCVSSSDSTSATADPRQKYQLAQTTEEKEMMAALQLSLTESFKAAEQCEVEQSPLAREPTTGA